MLPKTYNKRTIAQFTVLTLLQGLFGIDRHCLIKNSTVSKYFYMSLKITYIVLVFICAYKTKTSTIDIKYMFIIYAMCLDFLFLLTSRRSTRKLFDSLDKLDENCRRSIGYCKKVKSTVRSVTLVTLGTLIIDGTVLLNSGLPWAICLVILLSLAAHESELMMYGLLTNCIRLRLAQLKGMKPGPGLRANKFILVATAQLVGCFSIEMFGLLTGTFISTYLYAILLFLADTGGLTRLVAFIVWRESKALYSLWYACSAANYCEEIHVEVSFCVTREIGKYTKAEAPKSSDERILRRWHRYLMSPRLTLVAGDCIHLALAVPLSIIEVVVSYLLIFVQCYRAYLMYV